MRRAMREVLKSLVLVTEHSYATAKQNITETKTRRSWLLESGDGGKMIPMFWKR